ncbi:protein FAM174C isoform X3 [Heliangelus exortis]|uniref:protein FAM174C isoform X3 n=1 Tax=Heliangelus exortis TaxID=472823 RepID=UPI003A941C38
MAAPRQGVLRGGDGGPEGLLAALRGSDGPAGGFGLSGGDTHPGAAAPRGGTGVPGTRRARNAVRGSAGPGRCLCGAAPSRRLPAPAPPRPRSPLGPVRPGPAMLLPGPLCRLLLLFLLLHGSRAASSTLSAAPSPLNATEATRAAAGNGTRPHPPPPSRRPPGSVLPAGLGLPVLKRAVYVLSALSVLAALYFLLRAFRLKKPQRRKYGLLASQEENMELASLDSDEDTVFETRNLRR